jgi:hypothetical protein
MKASTDLRADVSQIKRWRRYLKCLRRRCEYLQGRLVDLGEKHNQADRMKEEIAALTWATAVASETVEETSDGLAARIDNHNRRNP